MKKWFVVIIIFSLSIVIVGSIVAITIKNKDLSEKTLGDIYEIAKFFPSEETVWEYRGTGDYVQKLKLVKIQNSINSIIYKIDGEVKNNNKDESFEDYLISLRYIISEFGLRQQKVELNMIDSKYNDIYILKFPLEVGTTWKENVYDEYGKRQTIIASIEKIEKIQGEDVITIFYDEQFSKYYEKRVLRENVGLIKFEKNDNYEGLNYKVGYELERFNNGKLDKYMMKNEIYSFLVNYDIAWEKYFNNLDNGIFKFISEESRLNAIFNRHKLTAIKIKFVELNIENIEYTDEKNIEVIVEEKFEKRSSNDKVHDISTVKYYMKIEGEKYYIKYYEVLDK